METVKRNRLRLEIPDEPAPGEHSRVETAYRASSSGSLFRLFLWIGLFAILAGVISLGVYWQFYKNSDRNEFSTQDPLNDRRSLDQILDKPYLPSRHVKAELNRCIQLYRENYIQRAFLACEEFLNSPATDEEKSIALTVLGVLFDSAGRYPIALEKLEKATRYDPGNFHAYYNLSLVFRHMGRMEEARRAAKKAREIAPSNPVIARLTGNLFSEFGDTEKAIEAYKSGLREAPDDPELLFNKALAEYRKGAILSAIEGFEKAIQNDSYGRIRALSHSYLGKIYYDQKSWKKAEYHYREVARMQPDNAEGLYNLGLVQLQLNEKEEAVRSFKKALEAGSNSTETFLRLAESLEDLKLPSLAIRALKKAEEIRPNDIDVLFALGELHYKRGELIQAENSFRKIITNTPGDSYTESALINLGIILDEMERYPEAIRSFEKALELNPKNYNAQYNLGLSLMKLGKPVDAIQSWEKASVLESRGEYKARERIADYYIRNSFWDKAISNLETILEENPNAYSIRLKLADVYRKTGQEKSSEKHLLYVLNHSESGKEIQEAHKILALLYNSSKDSELQSRALQEAYRATQMNPGDMESRLVLAKILANSESISSRDKAIEELKVIVASTASSHIIAQAYNLMGVCQYKNRDFRRAIQSFDNALQIDPTYTEAYDNKRAARNAYEEGLGRRGWN